MPTESHGIGIDRRGDFFGSLVEVSNRSPVLHAATTIDLELLPCKQVAQQSSQAKIIDGYSLLAVCSGKNVLDQQQYTGPVHTISHVSVFENVGRHFRLRVADLVAHF
jgi:hypothetical protein